MAMLMDTDRNFSYEGLDQQSVRLTSSTGKRNLSGMWPSVGTHWTRKNHQPDVAFMIVHYATDMSDHYLAGPLALRGFGVLGYGTRYRMLEERFILEYALDDIGAGIRWLKENTSVKKIIFIGNSGGGSIMAAFQARSEKDMSIVGADAFVFLNAHPDRVGCPDRCS